MRFSLSLLLFCLPFSLFADEVINPRANGGGYVSDNVGYLKESGAISEINEILIQLEAETSAEIAIVIIPSIADQNPKEFANLLFAAWGVGKKGKDNGVLFLHITDQRRVEIEIGDGLEHILTDIKCKRILNELVIPNFKLGHYSKGVYLGTVALSNGIKNPEATIDELVIISNSPNYIDPNLDEQTARIETTILKNKNETGFWTKHLQNPMKALSDYYYVWVIFLISIISFLFGELFCLKKFGTFQVYQFQKYTGGIIGFVSFSVSFIIFNYLEYYYTETLFSIIPLLTILIGLLFWNHSILNRIRNKPRQCFKCKATKQKLSEKDDDQYLSEGNQVEEKIKSRDYDVWLCKSCNDVHSEEYPGERSIDKCPKCHFKTHENIAIKVIRVADYNRGGEELHTYKCAYCSHTEVKRIYTPKLTRSSSSGGGGSSSGGGSFGGGRSSGGGAGGSY
ncbi:TPM domain-containing protein [Leptospira sp. 96542]|nr:TPM domain-containing protein [Leptospira sp. 96542]